MKYNFTDLVTFSGKACPSFEGEKIYISTGCLHTDLICKNETELVNYSNRPSRANLVAEPGDILFAKMQSTKKNIILSEETAKYIYSTGFYAIRANKNLINNKCLYYLISSDIFLKEKDKNCSGATQKAITNEGLKKIQINIPSIDIQKNIEKQLDAVSAIIAHEETQLQKLDDLVKARFVEMFDDGNEIRKVLIGDAVDLINGRAFKPTDWTTTGLPIIRIQNLNDVNAPYNHFDGLYDKKNYIEKGELLFSWSGTPGTSFGAFIWDRDPGLLNQHIFRVLPKKEYDLKFLRFALNAQLDEIISKAHGGVGLQHITKTELEKITIPYPSQEQQSVFSNFTTQVDKSKFAIQKSLEKTQQLFDSLMQEYFG